MKTTRSDSSQFRLWPRPFFQKVLATLSFLWLCAGLLIPTASAAIVPVDLAATPAIFDLYAAPSIAVSIPITVTPPAGYSVLVVMVGGRDNGANFSDCSFSWKGQPLQYACGVTSANGYNVGSGIFYLYNPTAGSDNLTGTLISPTGNSEAVVSWMTLSGVDTTAAVVTGTSTPAAAGPATPFTASANGVVVPKAGCFAVMNLNLRNANGDGPQTFVYSANSGAQTGTQVTYGVTPTPYVHSGAGYVANLAAAGTYDLSVTAPNGSGDAAGSGRYGMAAVVFTPATLKVAGALLIDLSYQRGILTELVGAENRVTSWSNFGSLGGAFVKSTDSPYSAYGINTYPAPFINNKGGYNTPDAGGGRCLISTVATPPALQGASTYSIETWLWKNNEATDQRGVFAWTENTPALGDAGKFCAGDPAAMHNGGKDLTWNGILPTSPTQNTWHHTVLTYDGTTETLYLDGAVVNSGAKTLDVSAATYYPIIFSGLFSATPPQTSYSLNGSIAALRVHSGALSAADVANNYARGIDALPGGSYNIGGTISCSDAADAAGAVVQLKSGASVVGSVTVATGGAYSFTVLPGTYTVTASKNTYATAVSSAIVLSSANFTQDLTLTKLPMCLVSGTVRDGGTGIGGVLVRATYSGGSVYTTSSVLDGSYSLEVPATLLVTMSASSIPPSKLLVSVPDPFAAPDTTPITDKDVVLAPNPNYEPGLLFSVKSSDLGATGGWPCTFPAATSLTRMGSPSTTTIDGQQWEVNNRMTSNDGWGFGGPYTSIPCNGVTIIAAVKPTYCNPGGEARGEIVDIMYDRLSLSVSHTDGRIMVCRNYWADWGPALADNTPVILSLVVQPDGSYVVYSNGVSVMTGGANGDFSTQMVPAAGDAFRKYVNVGRNNPDGWSAFNGNIGDVYVYNKAVGTTQRGAREGALGTKFGIAVTLPPSPATISGTVVAGGAGVIVTTSPEGLTGTTDAGGIYTITGATSGTTYTLTASNLPIGKLVDTAPAAFAPVPGANTGKDFTLKDAPSPAIIRGTVTDGGTGVQNVLVTANPGGLAGTTLPDGTYTITGLTGVEYTLTASNLPAGKMVATSPGAFTAVAGDNNTGKDFTLIADPANDTDLIFALRSSTLGTGAWSCAYPVGSSLARGGSPSTTTINGEKWETNHMTSGDRYNASSLCPAPYTINGGSIVVAVRPIRPTTDDHSWDWDSIVDMQYDQMVIGIRNWDGRVCVRRKGSLDVSGASIPSGQITVLSLVVQPNGNYKVWANGTEIMNNTGTADMSVLNGGLNQSAVGCNAYDGWPVFNGNIGDVYVYKVAIDDTKRTALESGLTSKFGTAAMYTVNATALTGGTISPSGLVSVPQNADQAFTITPANYYDVTSVLANAAEVVAGPNTQTYTMTNVTADGTIAASFTEWALTEVAGKVTTDGTTGVEGVLITATGIRGPFTTTTLSDGTFVLRVKPDATYTLTAYKAGFIASPASLTAGTGDLTGKDFTLAVNPPHTQPMFVSRGTGGWRGPADYWTIGSRIRTGASTVYVTKLGFVDRDQNGLNVTHQVGIWDVAGTLLGSVTVPAGTDGELIGDFRYAPLGTVIVLAPNSTYAIGGFTQGDDWPDQAPTPGFNEPDFVGFTCEQAIARNGDQGFNNPNPPGGFDWGACCAAINVFGSTVPPVLHITGIVTLEDGTTPIEGATVSCTGKPDATTLADGTYSIDVNLADVVTVSAVKSGFAVTDPVGNAYAITVAGDSTGINFKMGAASPFDSWVGPFFGGSTNPLIVGRAADPDGDGQNNLLEFALGGTPNNGALNAKVYSFNAVSTEFGSSNKVLVLTIAVRTGTPTFTGSPAVAVHPTDGVKYTVQGGLDMTVWDGIIYPCVDAILPAGVTPESAGAGYEYRSFILQSSDGLPGKGFLQVKIEPNP